MIDENQIFAGDVMYTQDNDRQGWTGKNVDGCVEAVQMALTAFPDAKIKSVTHANTGTKLEFENPAQIDSGKHDESVFEMVKAIDDRMRLVGCKTCAFCYKSEELFENKNYCKHPLTVLDDCYAWARLELGTDEELEDGKHFCGWYREKEESK